jgi:Putative beta barrel porin-7 (BBP7)
MTKGKGKSRQKAAGVDSPAKARQLRSEPMRHGFLVAVTALMAGAGLGWGQEPPIGSMPPGAGMAPGMDGVVGYPPPSNPEGLATNNVRTANVWFNVEYLGWWAKRTNTYFPLATTGSDAQSGVLGASSTSILFQRPTGNEFFNGGRVTGGLYFADDNRFGFQFGFFLLGDGTESFDAESKGSGVPLIARPVIEQSTGTPTSFVVGAPSIGPGKIAIDMETQTWGASADWVLNLYRTNPQSPWGYSFNLYAGFGVVSVRDNLDIVSSTDYFQNVGVPFMGQTFTSGAEIVTTRRLINVAPIQFLQTITDSTTRLQSGLVDRYRTSNQFYGGEFGFTSRLRVGRWGLGLNGKFGVGVVHSSVETQGYSTLFQVSDQTITTQRTDALGNVQSSATTRGQQVLQATAVGGLYNVGSRIGRQAHTAFAYSPEAQLNLSYQFTPTLTASVGYSFLYLSRVVRANSLVSQTVDTTQVPLSGSFGLPSPGSPPANLFPFTSYWVQGFNAGLSIQY